MLLNRTFEMCGTYLLKKKKKKMAGVGDLYKEEFHCGNRTGFYLFFGGSCADLCMWQNVIKLHKDY